MALYFLFGDGTTRGVDIISPCLLYVGITVNTQREAVEEEGME
jgi:hypothetical protein